MASNTGEVKKYVQKLKKAGYVVEISDRNSHYIVYDGQTGDRISTIASSPGDYRWRDNARADIRRWHRQQRRSLSKIP